jgi:UDP-GlcNAc:undecaprenyl-phosphate GlcNAc-1-phosphate transferase
LNSSIIILFSIINFFIIINFSKLKFINVNLDKPDKTRKFHLKNIPRAGGLLIIFNLIIYFFIINFNHSYLENEFFFKDSTEFNYFFISAFVIFIFGFLDDRMNINSNIKFISLIIIFILILYFEKQLIITSLNFSFLNKPFFLGNLDFIFTIFCFVVFLNSFNMFDGINLQASIYALILVLFFFIMYIHSIFLICLIISIIGFSILNFKNKTFLGDSGSLLIGFIVSYLTVKLYNSNYIIHADKVIILMIVPGLELIRLFILRIARNRTPLSSDREHIHHYLTNRFSYSKSLLIIFNLVLIPLIMIAWEINNVLIITITIITYSGIIFYSKKNSIHSH